MTAAIVGLLLVAPTGHQGTANSASAATLLDLAAVTDRQPAASSDRYWYEKQSVGGRITFSVERPFEYTYAHTSETWTGDDGSLRRAISEVQAPGFPTPQDEAAWRDQGAPPLRTPDDFTMPPGQAHWPDYSSYPADPGALYRKLRKAAEQNHNSGGRGDVAAETFVLATDLLISGPVPLRLRAAVYRAAAKIPGMEVAPNTADRSGRLGTALTLTTKDNGGLIERLIVDRATGQVLETQTATRTLPDGTPTSPVILSWTTSLSSGWVPTNTAIP